MKLSDLFQNGAVVALHVSRWQARARIKAADLGLPGTVENEKALSLGVHRLAAATDLASVNRAAAEAARAIERVGRSFPMVPGGRYVLLEAVEPLAARLAEVVAKFNAAADEVEARYGELRANQLLVVRAGLVRALLGSREGVEAQADAEAAADTACARLAGEYPVSVRGKFELRFEVFTLQSAPSEAVQALSNEAGRVTSIVQSMVEGLRDDVASKLGAILETVATGGKIGARSIGSALMVLDRVDELNVMGDRTLAEQSRRLRKLLNSVETVGEISVVDGLRDVQQRLKEDTAEAVAAAVESFTSTGRRRLAAV